MVLLFWQNDRNSRHVCRLAGIQMAKLLISCWGLKPYMKPKNRERCFVCDHMFSKWSPEWWVGIDEERKRRTQRLMASGMSERTTANQSIVASPFLFLRRSSRQKRKRRKEEKQRPDRSDFSCSDRCLAKCYALVMWTAAFYQKQWSTSYTK